MPDFSVFCLPDWVCTSHLKFWRYPLNSRCYPGYSTLSFLPRCCDLSIACYPVIEGGIHPNLYCDPCVCKSALSPAIVAIYYPSNLSVLISVYWWCVLDTDYIEAMFTVTLVCASCPLALLLLLSMLLGFTLCFGPSGLWLNFAWEHEVTVLVPFGFNGNFSHLHCLALLSSTSMLQCWLSDMMATLSILRFKELILLVHATCYDYHYRKYGNLVRIIHRMVPVLVISALNSVICVATHSGCSPDYSQWHSGVIKPHSLMCCSSILIGIFFDPYLLLAPNQHDMLHRTSDGMADSIHGGWSVTLMTRILSSPIETWVTIFVYWGLPLSWLSLLLGRSTAPKHDPLWSCFCWRMAVSQVVRDEVKGWNPPVYADFLSETAIVPYLVFSVGTCWLFRWFSTGIWHSFDRQTRWAGSRITDCYRVLGAIVNSMVPLTSSLCSSVGIYFPCTSSFRLSFQLELIISSVVEQLKYNSGTVGSCIFGRCIPAFIICNVNIFRDLEQHLCVLGMCLMTLGSCFTALE